MKKVYSCNGISLGQHNEPAGYQYAWHYHIHVIPRYIDDIFNETCQEKKFMPILERAIHAEKLRVGLEKLAS